MAGPQDERRIWEWVNDPVMLGFAFQTHDPVPWENHRKWFAGTLEGKKRTQYVVETADGTPVGQIRFEPTRGSRWFRCIWRRNFAEKGWHRG